MIEYSDRFSEVWLTGNSRTPAGSQIEEWISPGTMKIFREMDHWKGNKTFQFEVPNEGKGEMSVYFELFEKTPLPKSLPDSGYFTLYKSSKLTDFISGSFLSKYGIIISPRAKKILEKYQLGSHKFYPLYLEYKSEKHEYYLFRFLNTADPYLEIDKSEFYVNIYSYDPQEDRKVARFANESQISDFQKTQEELELEDSEYLTLKTAKLHLSFPKWDVFMFHRYVHGSQPKMIVSERLSDDLKHLTGLDLVPTDKFQFSINNE